MYRILSRDNLYEFFGSAITFLFLRLFKPKGCITNWFVNHMIEPFRRGKAWYMYNELERDFIKTISYVPLETVHSKVWSEKFAELLIRIGSSVDSFFRYMVKSESLDNQEKVKKLREKIEKKREKEPDWSPNVTEFRKTFNPIYQLSSVEVEADYGLTYYGKLQPFKDFDKKSPIWWVSYNKVKHEMLEQLNRATLENTINALAALFVLNILHKESQKYLIRHTNVIFAEYMSKYDLERFLSESFMGVPKNVASKFIARTPLFTHIFRPDENVTTGKYLVSN